jgi:hypothetical protein
MPFEKLKRHKSPSVDQVPAELIISGGRTSSCEIYKLFNSIWNKEKLPEDCKESIIVLYLSIRKVIKQIIVIIEAYYFCHLHTKFYPTSCCQG